MEKAKFLYKTRNKAGDVEWWYEYRGYEYSIVPFKTEWSLADLHNNEQSNIDRLIDINTNLSTLKSEPAEKGFQLFWDYLDA